MTSEFREWLEKNGDQDSTLALLALDTFPEIERSFVPVSQSTRLAPHEYQRIERYIWSWSKQGADAEFELARFQESDADENYPRNYAAALLGAFLLRSDPAVTPEKALDKGLALLDALKGSDEAPRPLHVQMLLALIQEGVYPQRAIRWTSAPKDYDSFGTVELEKAIGRANRVYRKVLIDPRHLDWHIQRYSSGLHDTWEDDYRFQELVLGKNAVPEGLWIPTSTLVCTLPDAMKSRIKESARRSDFIGWNNKNEPYGVFKDPISGLYVWELFSLDETRISDSSFPTPEEARLDATKFEETWGIWTHNPHDERKVKQALLSYMPNIRNIHEAGLAIVKSDSSFGFKPGVARGPKSWDDLALLYSATTPDPRFDHRAHWTWSLLKVLHMNFPGERFDYEKGHLTLTISQATLQGALPAVKWSLDFSDPQVVARFTQKGMIVHGEYREKAQKELCWWLIGSENPVVARLKERANQANMRLGVQDHSYYGDQSPWEKWVGPMVSAGDEKASGFGNMLKATLDHLQTYMRYIFVPDYGQTPKIVADIMGYGDETTTLFGNLEDSTAPTPAFFKKAAIALWNRYVGEWVRLTETLSEKGQYSLSLDEGYVHFKAIPNSLYPRLEDRWLKRFGIDLSRAKDADAVWAKKIQGGSVKPSAYLEFIGKEIPPTWSSNRSVEPLVIRPNLKSRGWQVIVEGAPKSDLFEDAGGPNPTVLTGGQVTLISPSKHWMLEVVNDSDGKWFMIGGKDKGDEYTSEQSWNGTQMNRFLRDAINSITEWEDKHPIEMPPQAEVAEKGLLTTRAVTVSDGRTREHKVYVTSNVLRIEGAPIQRSVKDLLQEIVRSRTIPIDTGWVWINPQAVLQEASKFVQAIPSEPEPEPEPIHPPRPAWEEQSKGEWLDTSTMDAEGGVVDGPKKQAVKQRYVMKELVALGWKEVAPGMANIRIGGGVKGGDLNPSGARIISMGFKPPFIQATIGWGEVLVSQMMSEGELPKEIAGKFHAAVLATGEPSPSRVSVSASPPTATPTPIMGTIDQENARNLFSGRGGMLKSPLEMARERGEYAFKRGMAAVPGLDPALMFLINEKASTPDERNTLMDAWSKAWTAANLSAPVKADDGSYRITVEARPGGSSYLINGSAAVNGDLIDIVGAFFDRAMPPEVHPSDVSPQVVKAILAITNLGHIAEVTFDPSIDPNVSEPYSVSDPAHPTPAPILNPSGGEPTPYGGRKGHEIPKNEWVKGQRVVTKNGEHGKIIETHTMALSGYMGAGKTEPLYFGEVKLDSGRQESASVPLYQENAPPDPDLIVMDPVRNGTPLSIDYLWQDILSTYKYLKRYQEKLSAARKPDMREHWLGKIREDKESLSTSLYLLQAWRLKNPQRAVNDWTQARESEIIKDIFQNTWTSPIPISSPASSFASSIPTPSSSPAMAPETGECADISLEHPTLGKVEVVCGAHGHGRFRRDTWHNIFVGATRYGWNGQRWAKDMQPSKEVLDFVRSHGIAIFG